MVIITQQYDYAIKYKRPNLKKLAKEGLSSVDMHVHTKYSDGVNRVQTILKRCQKKNLGIAITDHNEIKGSVEAFKSRGNVLVVPGIEVNSKEGPDVLVYFYDIEELKEFYNKYIKHKKGRNPNSRTKLGVEEIIDFANEYNSLVSLAHPFGLAWKNYEKFFEKYDNQSRILDKVDCVEILCGAQSKKSNMRAVEWRSELGKCFTGGSDAHTLFEVGKVVTCSYANSLEFFLESIEKKQNMIIGKTTKFNKLVSYSRVIGKHSKYPLANLRNLIPDIKDRLSELFGIEKKE